MSNMESLDDDVKINLSIIKSNNLEVDLIEEYVIEEHVKLNSRKFKNDVDFHTHKDDEEAKNYVDRALLVFGVADKIHNRNEHEKMLELFRLAIRLAPHDSYQLERAYYGRALILHHINKFDACIQNCLRALRLFSNPSSVALYVQYLCLSYRESKKPLAKTIRDFALMKLNEYCNDEVSNKSIFVRWSKNYLRNALVTEEDEPVKKFTRKKYHQFERHENIMCASKSLELIRNDKGKMCVIACKDIEPGEVIVVEKKSHSYMFNFDAFISPFCNHCQKQSWTLIPCENCTSEMYCSEDCRSKDWSSYHKWMCNIFPADLKPVRHFLRFFFDLLEETGGLDKFADYCNQGEQIEESIDRDFDYIKYKYFSDFQEELTIPRTWLDFSCTQAYYLSKKTDFLGKKFNKNINIFNDKRGIFLSAVILRSYLIIQKVYFASMRYSIGSKSNRCLGMNICPFIRYLNHSCCPNTDYFTSNDEETVVYARFRIKKGSTITVCYFPEGTFLDAPRFVRQNFLKAENRVNCTCTACEENWHPYRMQLIKILLKNNPELLEEINEQIMPTLNILKKFQKSGKIPFCYIEKIIDIMKMLHDKSLVDSMEYYIFLKFLHLTYIAYYGFVIEPVPNECFYKPFPTLPNHQTAE